MRAVVPVCLDCGKPHFGKNKSVDRCWCDSSGRYEMREIEVDEEVQTVPESMKV